MWCLFFLIFSCSANGFLCSNEVLARLTQVDGFPSDFLQAKQELKKLSLIFEETHPFEPSAVPLDLMVLTVEKDAHLVPSVVEFAKCNVLHPIQNIYVVSPQLERIENLCRENGYHFVDESKVFPFQYKELPYWPKGIDRRGWLFQQLLKLNCDEICASDHVLVIDADTLLVRPQAFILGEYTVLNCAEEHHGPYYSSYERLLQEKVSARFSFVCHHMLFERSKLRHLKACIEQIHQKAWFHAIIDITDKNETSGFSEYETYGNFLVSYYPDQFIQLYFFNAELCRSRIGDFIEGKAKWDVTGEIPLDQTIKSTSFHHYH